MKKEKITAILLTVQEKDKFVKSNNKDGNYKKLKPEDSFKKLTQFFVAIQTTLSLVIAKIQ